MSTESLLTPLGIEVTSLDTSGETNISGLLKESESLLDELRGVEASLEAEIESGVSHFNSKVQISKPIDRWYKLSISNLKAYNTLINKFLKAIPNNPRFHIDLDDTYSYPLDLYNGPGSIGQDTDKPDDVELHRQHENHQALFKALILHLLKTSQSGIVKRMLMGLNDTQLVPGYILERFELLDRVVDDILVKHDLKRALEWIKSLVPTLQEDSYTNNVLRLKELEFKFHILQFALLLSGRPLDENNSDSRRPFSIDCAYEAYQYSMLHFPLFFELYRDVISLLMTLMLYDAGASGTTGRPDDEFERKQRLSLKELLRKLQVSFEEREKSTSTIGTARTTSSTSRGSRNESTFADRVFTSFKDIRSDQSLFVYLANEFISVYCLDMQLSDDSSIFQCMLAGFVNLPNFYKYNQIQQKLGRKDDKSAAGNGGGNNANKNTSFAANTYELPFHLPDTNTNLFNYHPIFICPVTKEQLVPLTESEEQAEKRRKQDNSSSGEKSLPHRNPVVVLKFCQHLALRDSIWQLLKRGTEIFKCHYCYKKHKFSDTSEANFIDF